jgi:hypothetical protein
MRHFRLFSTAPAVTLVVGTMILFAAAANAIPESTIASECADAGGTYTTTVLDGVRHSDCCYPVGGGKYECDVYKNGKWIKTVAQQSPPEPPLASKPLPPAPIVDPELSPPPTSPTATLAPPPLLNPGQSTRG